MEKNNKETDVKDDTARTKPDVKKVASSTTRIFGTKVMVHGYTALPNILLRGQSALELTPTQFNIISQLLSYWIDPGRPPYPSKKELAARMGITTDTLRINIAKLEERGLIQREQRLTSAGDYSSNTYLLDGLVAKLKALEETRFAKERREKQALRKKAEAPKRRRPTRAKAGGAGGTA